MIHSITNYQTSFRVEDEDGSNFPLIQGIIFDWLATKEKDSSFQNGQWAFAFRGDWSNLYRTRASISTDTYLSSEGNAWAVRYTHADKDLGARRFWYSDIGLRKVGTEIVVSVRISFAWHTEDLGHENAIPMPSVPYFVRRILDLVPVYSGRREFRLIQTPVIFKEVGKGKALCDFITSPNRRYPLIVFNGDTKIQMDEAKALAVQLAGKVQVAVIAENPQLAEEIRHSIDKEYRVAYGKLRVFFPFSSRFNSVTRHRWYDVTSPEYLGQKEGIIGGLLRNHSVVEAGAVETVADVRQLIFRSKLLEKKGASADQSDEMKEFFELYDAVEKQRDDYKLQSDHYANEVDSLEEQLRQQDWKAKELEARLEQMANRESDSSMADLLPELPKNLEEVVSAAAKFYPRLVFTEAAIRSARDHADCDCVDVAWEICGHMNNLLHRIKFDEDGPQDLEARFGEVSRYQLAMSEGKNTKKDGRLMALREISHEGRVFDITPHIKYGNKAPKMLRIHFAFDEEKKRIVIGFVGFHLENATTRKV